ncbi:Metallo-beta-lactamase family protein, RNA-specific [hydrothermal vent metagenome]|uniref:Metallo-beta-lactamase family protein, RNA-specific n=1 Tax=hydrothermal vent metagenome TaxID=652676 RepID=A0A1W1C203_9ZZZZ
MITIQSYGATKEVTGSCHIVKIGKKRIMIDCGMFQGEYEEKNQEAFDFDPTKIDVLLLTHAHLDHCGRIPKLVKEGFSGKIYATAPTIELTEVILLDSAKIMHEDYKTSYKKAQRKGEHKKVPKPIYDVADVYDTFSKIEWIGVEYDKYIELFKGIRVRYKNAGHILGSAFIEIGYIDKGESKKIVFSGDIGNDNQIVLPKLQSCKRCDTLYVETTYGDRLHQPLSLTLEEFKSVIIKTLKHRGNVLIPSFAVERTQELLCILRSMYENEELPSCKIFLDSPMATKTTNLYKKYSYELLPKCQRNLQRSGSVFNFDLLSFTQKPEESKRINEIKEGAIIIAGSGMCNGGRILHHFKHRIWNPNNAIIFVGYQANGTLGREIINGAKWINIFGEDIIIKASIHTINGFSAHADQNGIIKWIKNIKNLQKIFLVHGELEAQKRFKKVLKRKLNKEAHIVSYNEKIQIKNEKEKK